MVSRVARNPISLPTGVELKEVQLDETNFVVVKGKKGELKCPVPPLVELHHGEKTVSFALVRDTREANALAGTLRALVSNMVKGVTDGFEIKLLLVGVGYRAKAQGKTLELALGFSHPVVLDVQEGLRTELKHGGNQEAAKRIGRLVAERALALNVTTVAFDRSGFQYHGRVKALAEAAREAGLQF